MMNLEIESDSVFSLIDSEISNHEAVLIERSFTDLGEQKIAFGARRALKNFRTLFESMLEKEIKKMES